MIKQVLVKRLMWKASPLDNNATYRALFWDQGNSLQRQVIFRSNIERMVEVYGKHHATHKRSDGRRLYVWEVPYQDKTFLVYMAKGYGTSIELVDLTGSEEEGKQIMAFIDHLLATTLKPDVDNTTNKKNNSKT